MPDDGAAIAPAIVRLARATAPEGGRTLVTALARAGWASASGLASLLDSELSLPSRADRIDDAHLRVVYVVVASPAPPLVVHGVVAAAGAAAAAAVLRAAGAGREPLLVDELGLAVVRFPDDRALPWLTSASSHRHLAGRPEGIVDAPTVADALVRYRPGRRVILRFDRTGDRPGAYAKVQADGRDVTSLGFLRAVNAAAPDLPTATVLGHGPATATVWTADAGGVPFAALVDAADATDLGALAGRHLASLHRSGVDAPPAVGTDRAVVEAGRRTRRLRTAVPGLGTRLEMLDRVLAREAPSTVGPAVTQYGDFHPQQLRVVDGGLVLLDLDSLRRGPAEHDLAEFGAHLYAARHLDDGRTAALLAAVVDSYRATTGHVLDRPRFRWHLRLELLQRAFGAMKTLAPGWEHDARLLVEAATTRNVSGLVPLPAPTHRRRR